MAKIYQGGNKNLYIIEEQTTQFWFIFNRFNTMDKRYQGGNQNLYIIEEQTTQWPKDTKGVIRICNTDSNYTLGIFWPLCRLFFYDIQILITPWYLWPLCSLFFYDIQILITSLVSFGHCVVCSSMIYRFVLPPWYILAIVLSVLLKIPRGNQNLYIIEEQTTQWPKDTKGVIRICIS
jgi:hypothetical protein